jgi:hypothetical protein
MRMIDRQGWGRRWLIALTLLGCSGADSQSHLLGRHKLLMHQGRDRTKPLPRAWLGVALYANGTRRHMRTFGSVEDAQVWLSEQHVVEREGRPVLSICEDGPEVRVRREGGIILEPCQVTARENWVEQNSGILRPFVKLRKAAVLYTWKRAESSNGVQTRVGGEALLPVGKPWPQCEMCLLPLKFVCSLALKSNGVDHGSPLVSHFHCASCLGLEGKTYWISTLADAHLVPSAKPNLTSPLYAGEPWEIEDYPWDAIKETVAPDQLADLGGTVWWHCKAHGAKSGGLPTWYQKPEIPTCECGRATSFVGQFVSFAESEISSNGTFYFFKCVDPACTKMRSVLQAL